MWVTEIFISHGPTPAVANPGKTEKHVDTIIGDTSAIHSSASTF
jgi:hypothetical protein